MYSKGKCLVYSAIILTNTNKEHVPHLDDVGCDVSFS